MFGMIGIDSNCDKADDFDQDGDGFVPDEYEGIETLDVVGTGLLSGGDCEDTNANRNPGMEEVVADGSIRTVMRRNFVFEIKMQTGTAMVK